MGYWVLLGQIVATLIGVFTLLKFLVTDKIHDVRTVQETNDKINRESLNELKTMVNEEFAKIKNSQSEIRSHNGELREDIRRIREEVTSVREEVGDLKVRQKELEVEHKSRMCVFLRDEKEKIRLEALERGLQS